MVWLNFFGIQMWVQAPPPAVAGSHVTFLQTFIYFDLCVDRGYVEFSFSSKVITFGILGCVEWAARTVLRGN